jgi:type IV secretory pathway VirB2 component (pilin)
VILCNLADMVTGNLGRGLATCAVLTIGVGATLGKVSWGLAITVAVGISVIFNAPLVLLALTGVAGC